MYCALILDDRTDSWMIRAVENGHGGTRVSVSVGTQAGSVSGVATGSNTAAPLTTPSMGGSVNGTAIYDVFWARMDYLLGRRQVWMTCHAANKKVSAGLVWGDNSALCNAFNIKDNVPEGAIIREPEQAEKCASKGHSFAHPGVQLVHRLLQPFNGNSPDACA